jgi:hypothetical protein
MSNAKTLLPAARSQLTPAFRVGATDVDLTDLTADWDIGRDLPIDDIGKLLFEARASFKDEPPSASDRWLAPRLHACLRLTRAEAAERWFWAWLAVECFPDYVRWRFPGKGEDEEDESKRGTPLKRFIGRDRDHALARLWWGAELFRNGGDYEPAARAFEMQDVPNTWLSLNAVHNAAAAQAALRYLPSMTSDTINDLSRTMDHILTTIQLDVVAPVHGPDTIATQLWLEGRADIEDLLEDRVPAGPEEDPPDAEHVAAVDALLRHVADVAQLTLPEAPPAATAEAAGR